MAPNPPRGRGNEACDHVERQWRTVARIDDVSNTSQTGAGEPVRHSAAAGDPPQGLDPSGRAQKEAPVDSSTLGDGSSRKRRLEENDIAAAIADVELCSDPGHMDAERFG